MYSRKTHAEMCEFFVMLFIFCIFIHTKYQFKIVKMAETVKTAKIKTLFLHERGKERSTTFGIVKFDENGIAELPYEQAVKLTNTSNSLVLVESENSQVTKDSEPLKTDSNETKTVKLSETTAEPPKTPETPLKTDSDVDDVNKMDVDIIETDIKTELQSMNMSEIRQMLVEAGVDEVEINKPEFKGKEGKPALIEFAIGILTKE